MAQNDAYVSSFGDEEKQASSAAIRVHSDDVKIVVASKTEKRLMDKGDDVIPPPYAGMPKEVLLHYSRQKRFVWARNILASLVLFTLLLLLSLVIAFIAISPACQQFWQTSPIYQVYPKSFKDSDGDGVGDIRGIIDKLDYLKDDLGVNILYMNPVYKSPMVDNGYDIEDHRAIDPMFGSMEDMEDLITAVHDRGMYLVMDFIPNHTSDRHKWFLASSNTSHEEHAKYKDYYVWAGDAASGIPNNWQSVFDPDTNSSAWEFNSLRGQFYFHDFYKEQPDLNLRNEKVQQELLDILSFWLDKGVDGFRCDAVKFMLEQEHLRDNPLKDDTKPPSYNNMWPDYTENQIGIHDIVADWRDVLRKYSTEPGVYRFMMVEIYDNDPDVIARYYGNDYVREADFPMNFQLVELSDPAQWTGTNLEREILTWMEAMPEGKWPNWMVGNHDVSRLVSRMGDDGLARCASLLTMTLMGTAGIYYGEEIGMTNTTIASPGDFRDPSRTPMQWSNATNAGFSTTNSSTWLPVNPNYPAVNVQIESSDSGSMLSLYKSLRKLQQELPFRRGWLCMIHSDAQWLAYVREMPGTSSYVIVINLGDARSSLDLGHLFDNLPASGARVLSTTAGPADDAGVSFDAVEVDGNSGVVVEYNGGDLFQKTNMTDRCFVSKKICLNAIGLLQKC